MQGKRPSESQTCTSMLMLPEDANPWGHVHGGVILKSIDNTAALVAMRHARCNVVTASLDRMEFIAPAHVGELVTLRASLNFVGRSSMEVGVRVEAENLMTGEVRHTGSAYLTFVALDKDRNPIPVPPLLLETEEDFRREAEARDRRKSRLEQKMREQP